MPKELDETLAKRSLLGPRFSYGHSHNHAASYYIYILRQFFGFFSIAGQDPCFVFLPFLTQTDPPQELIFLKHS